MTFPEFWRKTAPVNQQYMFLVKEFKNEGFVISSPMFVSETNEHVEGATGLLDFKTLNVADSPEAMVSLSSHAMCVLLHPLTVALQTCEVAKLCRC